MSKLILVLFAVFLIGVTSAQRTLRCRVDKRGICTFLYDTIRSSDDIRFEAINAEEDRVLSVAFLFSDIEVIPESLFTTFQNLEQLELTGQKLARIEPGTFRNATRLTYFHAESNNIKEIKEGVFDGAVNLLDVSLSQNRIESIDENAFHGLRNLEYVYLDNNKIASLPKNLFESNIMLEGVALMNNLIEAVPRELFAQNRRLLAAYFDHNKIDSVDSRMFNHLENLIYVTFADNVCVNRDFKQDAISEIRKTLLPCSTPVLIELQEQVSETFKILNSNFNDFDARYKSGEQNLINLAEGAFKANQRLQKIEEIIQKVGTKLSLRNTNK